MIMMDELIVQRLLLSVVPERLSLMSAEILCSHRNCLFIRLFICLRVRLSVCVRVCLCMCMYVWRKSQYTSWHAVFTMTNCMCVEEAMRDYSPERTSASCHLTSDRL